MDYKGQLLQDQWIIEQVFPGVTDGYYLDIGAYDGVCISNTYNLELLGWDGICIEPSPSLYPLLEENRKCNKINVAVDSSRGIRKFLDILTEKHRGYNSFEEINRAQELFPELKDSWIQSTTVVCQTLDSVLELFDAPDYIHYMSLDIEGAELACLEGCDFSRRKFGALTIEHNHIADNRDGVRDFMRQHGYRLERQVKFEDWFLPE